VRNTYAAMLNVPASQVRVRRTTPDSSDASDVSELECSSIKWFI
jgi:hypothetical protein